MRVVQNVLFSEFIGKFQKYMVRKFVFDEYIEGKKVERVMFRKGDPFHDLAELLNNALFDK